MTRLTYYPPAVVEVSGPVTYACATEGCGNTTDELRCDACCARPGAVRHGYILAELDSIAKHAANSSRVKYGSDWVDVHETAWFGVVECLYTETRPQRYDLVQAGMLAVSRMVQDRLHHHGYFKAHTQGSAAGPFSSPSFLTFWHRPPNLGRSEHVVDYVALGQILAALTVKQRAALMALATTGDHVRAAELLGVPGSTFGVQLSRARNAFFALWHEGEAPSRRWAKDRRPGVSGPTSPLKSLRRRNSSPLSSTTDKDRNND